MLNRNRGLFLVFLSILLITIGLSAISAVDINSTDSSIYELNDNANNHIDSNVEKATDNSTNNYANINYNKQYDGKDFSKTAKNTKTDSIISVENYNDLRNEIIDLDGEETVTINLEGDEIYDITLPITYGEDDMQTTNLIIEGNGRTIDGSDANIFMTILDGFSLTINNITIKNIQGTNGSAFVTNGNLTIANSTFTDCSSTEHGGLIFVNGSGTLTLENSIIKNINSTMGGAIATFSTSNINIINNTITNTSAQQFGGFIYNYNSNVSVVNNTINQTTAGVNGGMAVMMKNGNLTIANNTIQNSKTTLENGNGGLVTVVEGGNLLLDSNTISNVSAARDGALLSNSGNATVVNNVITNTTAIRYGTIINQNNNLAQLNITNNTFNNPYAIGGVLYNFKNATIANNTINHARGNNTASIVRDVAGAYTKLESNIINDSSANQGGLIFALGKVELYDNVINNSQSANGGVVWAQNTANVLLVNNTITNSKATTGYGGVVSANGNADIRMYNNTIINASTTKEGAVVNAEGDSLEFTGNIVSNVEAASGGVIRHIKGELLFEDNTISNSTVSANGGVVYSHNPSTLRFNNNNITDITAKNGGILYYRSQEAGLDFSGNNISNVMAEYGGIYYSTSSTVTIDYNQFNNITATKYGSIIYNNGQIIFSDNVVSNSTASRGIIYSTEALIGRNTFISNKVTGTSGQDAVIYITNTNEADVSNNKFYNNTDYTRDMLFSDEYDVVTSNEYVGNYLIDTATIENTNASLPSEGNLTIDVNFELRNYYNDQVRSGTVIVTLEDGSTLEYEVHDNKATLQFNYDNIMTSQTVSVSYRSDDKSYQDIYIGTINITKPPKTIIAMTIEGDYIFDKGNGTYETYPKYEAKINVKLTDENGNPIANAYLPIRHDDGMPFFEDSGEYTNSTGESYAINPVGYNQNMRIYVSYEGDETHSKAEAEVYLIFIKYDLTIDVTPKVINATKGDYVEYTVDIQDYKGQVEDFTIYHISIDGEYYDYDYVQDEYGFTVDLPAGVHNVTFYVNENQVGTNNYAEETVTLIVYEMPDVIFEDTKGVIGEETILTAKIEGAGTQTVSEGTVSFYYSNETLIGTAPVIDGKAQIPVTIDDIFYDVVSAKYNGAGYYLDSDEVWAILEITKRTPKIDNNPVINVIKDTNLNVNGTFTYKDTPLADKTLRITLVLGDDVIFDDIEVTTDNQGFFKTPDYLTTEETTGYATIDYDGDEIYEGVTGYYLDESDNIAVSVINEVISIELDEITDDIYYNDSVSLTGKVLKNDNPYANAELTLRVNDETFTVVTDDEGKFSLQYNNTQTISYNAYAKYNSVISNIINFTVKAQQTTITLEQINDTQIEKSVNITGKLTDINNIPLGDSTVIIYINAEEYAQLQTDELGQFSIEDYELNVAGLKNITAVYQQTTNYQNSSASMTFNVTKIHSNISMSIWPGYVTKITGMEGSLSDEYGNPIGNVNIEFKIDDDVDEVLHVVHYGGFDYEYTPKTSGVHNLTITFNETDKYYQTVYTYSFNISKIPTKFDYMDLNANNQIGAQLMPFFVLLEVNEDDTFISISDEVTVIINNETFKQEFVVWEQLNYVPTKGGQFNITLIYDGNDVYEGCNKTVTTYVELEPIRIYQANSGYARVNETFTLSFTVTSREKPVNGTVDIYHYYHGDYITSVKVTNGKASFTYSSAESGQVYYTAIFNQTDKYSSAEGQLDIYIAATQTQLTQLTLINDMIVGESQDITYQLTTLKTNTPAANQNIRVNITSEDGNVNTYEITTDEEGKATITFNATMPGTYEITAIYENDYYSSLYEDSNSVEDKIIVKKSETRLEITPQSQEVYVDDEAKVQISLLNLDNNQSIANETITVIYNDNEKQLKIPENGILEVTIPTTQEDEFNIIAYYDTTPYYEQSENISTIKINKYNVTLSSENITAKVLNEFNLTITVKDNLENNVDEGNIIFAIDDTYNHTITENPIIIPLTINETTQSEITITYEDNRKYNTNSTTITINIEKLDTNIEIDEITPSKVNTNITVTGTITDENDNNINEGTINIIINNETFTTQITDGKYSYDYQTTTVGTNNITVSYDGTQTTYNPQNENAQFEVIKQDASITIDEIEDTKINEDITITGTLQDEQKNPIKEAIIQITINNQTINTTTDNEGKYSYTYTTESIGQNNITVTYEETEKYNKAENTQTFNVNQLTTKVTINPIDTVELGQDVTITGEVLDENEQIVSEGLVSIQINDNEAINVEIKDDKYEYTTSTTELGTNNITVQYLGLEKYTESEKTQATFITEQIRTTILLDDISDAKVDDIVVISGKLIDSTGNVIVGEDVVLSIANNTVTLSTDDEGKFSHDYNADSEGEYEVTASFDETETYSQATNVTKTFKVDKYDTVLSLDDVSEVKVDDVVVITGSLKDSSDNPVVGETVVLTVDEQSVSLTTDDEGKFSHDYKATADGLHEVTASFDATTKYNEAENITKTFNVDKYDTTITLDDISDAKVDDIVVISGKLIDSTGNAIVGEDVVLSIANNTVTLSTDDEGKFSHDYKATADGLHEVTASFDATTKYNEAENITKTFNVDKYDTTITLDDISDVKVDDVVVIAGSLKDSSDNPLVGETVVLTVDEESVSLTTDDEGKFSHDYKATADGLHEVTASFDATTKYNEAENITKNFTVNKIKTNITLNEITDVKIGEQITITGKLTDETNNPIKTNITLKINDNTQTIETNDEGIFEYNYTADKQAQYNITASYGGNNKYTPSNQTKTLKATEIKTTITLNNISDVKVGSQVTITGSLTDELGNKMDNAEITITINNQTIKTKTNNSIFTYNYTVNKENNYTVTATYPGNNTYKNSTANTTFKATKIKTQLSLDKINDTKVGSVVVISGKLLDESQSPLKNRNIQLNIGNTSANVKSDDKGMFVYNYTAVQNTTYTLSAIYTGDDKYLNSTANTTFKATKTNTKITIDKLPNDIKIGDKLTITGQLTDENNNKLPNTNITLTVNGQKSQIKTDTNGKYSYTYQTNKEESLSIQATYNGNNSHVNSTGTTKANVRKIYTDLTLNNINNTKINKTITVKGTLTDENNKKIANANIIIDVDDEEKTIKTNNNGIYEYNITIKETGSYTVSVSYAGDDRYDYADTLRQSFEVDKLNTKLSINNITDKIVEDTVTITGQLTDENNNPIVNANISIKLNTNTITATTDKNGKYTYNYQTNKEETLTVTVDYAGNSSYNSNKNTTKFKVTKLTTKLTLNNINNTKINGTTTITGTLKDQNSKAIANATISIKIANNIYTTKTDNAGSYTYTYKATKADKYDTTVSYNGTNRYKAAAPLIKTFTVNKLNTKLSLNNITNYKVGDKIIINGTLTDENNKTIPSANINININNQTTNIKTTSKGVYNYNFIANQNGTFTLKVSYEGDSNYNAATNISKTYKVDKIKTTITANDIQTKVGNQKSITITVTDENNKAVTEGNVTIIDVSGKVIANMKLKNGKATYTKTCNQTENTTVTIIYNQTSKYLKSMTTNKIVVEKADTKVIINPITAKVQDNITINATILDENNNMVNGGKVIFKVNGVTLKDDSGKTLIAQAVNGKASVNFTVPKSWITTNKTIVAYYQGTSNTYNPSTSSAQNITLSLRTAKMNLTTSPYLVKMDHVITLTAKVYEANTTLNSGVVIFKLNGVTIKDANGKAIQVKVVNGIASLKYTIPDGWSAKAVKVTAVYSNSLYERLEQDAYFNITKTVPHYNVTVKVNSTTKKATVTGMLLDEYNHNVKGQNTIAIKINGISLKRDNGKVQYFVVQEGVINITFDIPSNYKSGNYTLELVTGARNAYEAARNSYNIKI